MNALDRWPVRPGVSRALLTSAAPKSRAMLRDGVPVVSHRRQSFPERALLDLDKRIVWAD